MTHSTARFLSNVAAALKTPSVRLASPLCLVAACLFSADAVGDTDIADEAPGYAQLVELFN
ncbi:MAG: hypothetical protein KGY48_06725 [Wenzhouxiangellaceae bacterium]|jgi:hypothetical protein|nr:hypothetical protein [Wenzhouxiangellaceae bacterium]MBS3823070.1 hypothetical protein [Wenzhouxiangellaceae bacterium]